MLCDHHPLAAVTGTHISLFTYLWRSVLRNDATQTVLQRLEHAGFERPAVSTTRVAPQILHTYVAYNQGRRT